MSVEAFTPPPIYTIQNTGPYAFNHAFRAAEDIAVTVVEGTVRTALSSSDFTVTPQGPASAGSVTLSAAAFAAHQGKSLQVDRATRTEQGWVGQTAREIGLERQLDIDIMAIQELRAEIARTVRFPRTRPAPEPLDVAGRLLATGADGALTTVPLIPTSVGAAEIVYTDAAAFLASDEPSRGQGVIWRASFHSYLEAASDAADHHLVNADGVKFYVLPGQDGKYNLHAFGITAATSDVQDHINTVLQKLPAGAALVLPAGRYRLMRTNNTNVRKGSAFSFGGIVFDGIIGAIYLDKDGQSLHGEGWDTHLDGQGEALNCVMMRANRCLVTRMRMGNCAGQLVTNESAGVAIVPQVTQGAGGADITENRVVDVDIYDVDSGVTSSAEMDLNSSPRLQYASTRTKCVDVRIQGYRRQAYELALSHNSEVLGGYAIGSDRGAYSVTRFLRTIGSDDVLLQGCYGKGFDASDTGNFAIEASTLGFYGDPDYYASTGNLRVVNCHFHNYYQDLNIQESRGSIHFSDCLFTCDDDTDVHYVVRLETNGISNPAGAVDLANKKTADRVYFQNCHAQGKTQFALINGRCGHVILEDVTHVSNERADAGLLNLSLAGNADPTLAALESVGLVELKGNTSILPPIATGGDIRIQNLKAGDQVIIHSHTTTAPKGSELIHAASGDADVIVADPYCIRRLPSAVWTRDFDPPRVQQFGGN